MRLGEHRVGYALRRARRSSIGFVVSAEGLQVNAPRWVSLQNIDSAVQAKSGWILRKLQEQRERARRVEAARIEWRDGTSLPFLGETVIIVLDPRVAGAVLNADAQALPGVPRLVLHVGLPQTAEPEQIRDTVQSWLQRQALRIFTERCKHFAETLGVTDDAAVAQRGADALGLGVGRRLDPPELAPRALRPAGDRLRGGARTGAPA